MKKENILEITEDTQIRLTVTLQGCIKEIGSNSDSKKTRKKAARVIKYGGKWFSKFTAPTYQEAKESVLLNSETVQYFISEECRPGRTSLSDWKKKTAKERLEANLQVHADYISGLNHANFTYELIN